MSARRRNAAPEFGTYYHYTAPVESHLGSIMAEGAIRTTESNLSLRVDRAGPDVVWLLDRPLRRGETHGLITPQQQTDLKTHVEFAVRLPKAEVHVWTVWAGERRMHPSDWDVFVASGGGIAQALRWRVIERPIVRAEWLTVTNRVTGELLHRAEEVAS